MNILEVVGLTKFFGGYKAVVDFDMIIKQGELLGLVGPNGAGKTTVFNMITGFITPTKGKIIFKGKEITSLKPHKRAALGIVRTFQNTELFSSLTVEDNVTLGCHLMEKGGIRRFFFGEKKDEISKLRERVNEIISFTGLENRRYHRASDLPYGEQRVLEIAIALGANPTLLLLDEPVAGMNPAETKRCMGLLHQIIEKGTTVLLVEHDMKAVMNNCERVIVMNAGEKLAEGTPSYIQAHPEVIRSYLG
ncbi:MAG: hypothetical protein DRP55_07930 [Spirochaetes bacterium]|nr:ABC transporter ATP-binding protein [Deltaproteobacteria bacterium]RKX98901.1 MAG: hypothetical protein DRP55_07930 [Spirochaetota bacterium]